MKLVNCPTHARIADAAREEMAANERFMKAAVLSKTGFAPYARYIQWPYIRAVVEEELGGELLTPIPEPDGRWDPHIHPEKFLPGGKRKIAGYARVKALAPEVSTKWAERRYNSAVGTWHSMERLVLSYQKQGIGIVFQPTKLPTLQLR
jgi:hypothetical protein